jgi:hypothetical protein
MKKEDNHMYECVTLEGRLKILKLARKHYTLSIKNANFRDGTDNGLCYWFYTIIQVDHKCCIYYDPYGQMNLLMPELFKAFKCYDDIPGYGFTISGKRERLRGINRAIYAITKQLD